MKPLFIEGIGILNARGRGLERFKNALETGWTMPAVSAEGRPAYRIDAEDLIDRTVLKQSRRADRFSRLAVLTAHDALMDAGLDIEDAAESTGIILATAFGTHSTIFKFLDDIIDYGECNVSPTTFAHSIHNAAASYVASALKCNGPNMTITQFHFSFHQALMLAYAWLQEERVDRVLLGAVDECSAAMEYICEEKLSVAADGKMKPLSLLEKPEIIPGEGGVFFLLSLAAEKGKYGSFSDMKMEQTFKGWEDASFTIIAANGMSGSEKAYEALRHHGKPLEAYSPIYGGMMTGSAFECAAAALMLKQQEKFASPVLSDGTVRENHSAVKTDMDAIQCVSHNCHGELAFIKLSK